MLRSKLHMHLMHPHSKRLGYCSLSIALSEYSTPCKRQRNAANENKKMILWETWTSISRAMASPSRAGRWHRLRRGCPTAWGCRSTPWPARAFLEGTFLGIGVVWGKWSQKVSLKKTRAHFMTMPAHDQAHGICSFIVLLTCCSLAILQLFLGH